MRRLWEAPFAARAAVAGATAVLWFTALAALGLLNAMPPLLAVAVPLTVGCELAFEALWRRQPSDDDYPS
jgi:hypothetical protein